MADLPGGTQRRRAYAIKSALYARSGIRQTDCGIAMPNQSIAPNASLTEMFANRFRELSGEAHVVNGLEDVGPVIKAIVQNESVDCVALAHLEDDLRDAVRSSLDGQLRVLEPPYPASELPALLDAAQIGITSADWGIAETATLVEVCTDDAVRLVSGLPRTHIGILRASTLVHKFTDAAGPMRQALLDNPSHCAISFISGPSRTGDIEMILTLGVHGPERAHAIIIEDQ